MSFGAGLLGALPNLIGLATEIGTAVPGLKKARRRNTAQRAVRQGQIKMSNAAVGSSQTGFGGTRGLALREGIRGAQGVARAALDPAATAAAQDEATYIQERDARNQRLAQFGGNMAAGVAATTEQVVKNRAATKAGEQDAIAQRNTDWGAPTNTVQDIAANQQTMEGVNQQYANTPGTTGSLEQPGQMQVPGANPPGLGAPQLPPPDMESLYNATLGLGPNPLLQMAPELEFKLRVSNLAAAEAQRQGVPIEMVGGRLNRAMQNAPANLGDLYGDSPNYDGGEEY